MGKIQLIHPENKNAIIMDKVKFDTLKDSFMICLKKVEQGCFKDLLAEVEKDLKHRNKKVTGKLEWNLFWVTLDLEAKKEIHRDKTISPFVYSIA